MQPYAARNRPPRIFSAYSQDPLVLSHFRDRYREKGGQPTIRAGLIWAAEHGQLEHSPQ